MARHRPAYLDLDTGMPQYILSFLVVVSRRVSSVTSQSVQLAGLFAAAVRLTELSSSGAVVSGQESPRGSLLSTDIQHAVLRRALYSPQVGSSSTTSPRTVC